MLDGLLAIAVAIAPVIAAADDVCAAAAPQSTAEGAGSGAERLEPNSAGESDPAVRGETASSATAVNSDSVSRTGRERLSRLVAEARVANPEIRAARRAAEAAAARVSQAGAPPDPMLGVGIMQAPFNFDLGAESMTTIPLRLTQRIPAPGTLGTRRTMARAAHLAAVEDAAETELAVLTRLMRAFYEAYFVYEAQVVLDRNRTLLVDFAEVARARYAVGRVPQQDVLRAQTEITRLDEQIAALRARGAAAAAETEAILGRPVDRPFAPEYPQSVHRLAFAPLEPGAFTTAALESGLGVDGPRLTELQRAAVARRPAFKAHLHRVEIARQAVRLAERQRLPDVDLSLEYGARRGHPNLFSAMVMVGLPVFAGRKQRPRIEEAVLELDAHELLHHRMIHELEAEVASRYAAATRIREQIALLAGAVIPQARAMLEAAAGAYQADRMAFAGLLDAQAALFRHEVELASRLAGFGRELAELSRATGRLSIEEHD